MTDRFTIITPLLKPVVNAVFISINQRSRRYEFCNQGLDCYLLDIRQHTDHNLPTPLDHAKDRRLFFLQSTATTSTSQTVTAGCPPFFSPLQAGLYAPIQRKPRHIQPCRPER